MKCRTSAVLAGFLALLGSQGALAGAVVTYHGRILGPDRAAVETENVTFKIQVRSPGSANCLLYEETRTLDMRNSDGVFVIPIGDGSGVRSSADPGITIENIFSNNAALDHTGLSCNSGTHYKPSALDSRRLVVTFNDASGTGEQILPPMDVNYVPLALHAQEATSSLQVGSTPAAQVMSVSGGTASPLTSAGFTELLALVNGISTVYLKSSSLPSCGAGEVLKATGGNFVCVVDATGTDTLTGISCVDGKILKRVAGSWSCADESGVGTENDPTVQAYAKNAPAAGLIIDGFSKIAPDFGSTAGKVAQGNDSRFSDSRAPNGSATGDLSGSYPNPAVKGIRGNPVNATTPADGQVYKWVIGSSEFQPKYVGISDLRKTDGSPQMPATCAANETLSWSSVSDVLTCAAIGSLDASEITTGTLNPARLPADTMILTCADGKIPKRVSGAWACADDSGVGSETDPSVQAYAKNIPASGLVVDGSNKIAPDFGTGAGKVVEGNDARLSDARVAIDINGVASTGIIQRTGAGTFATLGTIAPINVTAGNIGLALGNGLTTSSNTLVPDFGTTVGKIAQGNDSRFPSATCAGGNKMRWDGTAWQCETDLTNDSSKVAKSGDTMTGVLNLPSDGLVVGTSQFTVSGGNVGIGTATPGDKLDVNGKIRATHICAADGTNCKDTTTSWAGGSVGWMAETKTSNFGVSASDNLKYFITTAGVAATLGPASTVGMIQVTFYASALGPIAIKASGGNSINGYAAYRLNAAGLATFFSDGTNWYMLSSSGGAWIDSIATTGYFVLLNHTTYKGNLGGLSGANDICRSAVISRDWLGRDAALAAGMLNTAKISAFLCNGSSCQNPQASSTFAFASTMCPSMGGATFTTDLNGLGPQNTLSWSSNTVSGSFAGTDGDGATCAYGGASAAWTGRAVGSNSLWPNTPDTNTCSNWTVSTAGTNGRMGYLFYTTSQRWSYGPNTCNGSISLICYVNP